MTDKDTKQPPLDELTKNVVEGVRTGVYAAVGLTDRVVTTVRDEARKQADAAKARRDKGMEQAEDFKARAANLPEEVKGWPEQLRDKAGELLAEAKQALNDLASHGKATVDRYQSRRDNAPSCTDDVKNPDVPTDDLHESAEANPAPETDVDVDTPTPGEDGEVSQAPGSGFEASEAAGYAADGDAK